MSCNGTRNNKSPAEAGVGKFMQPKISLLRSLIILGVAGAVFYSITTFFPADKKPVESVRNAAPESGLPVRLKIPSIKVDAAIGRVGLTPDGAMDVPKNPDEVAWFEPGKRPGENGSAVIAGHYGWKNGKAAAFDDLSQLRKGDKAYVEDDKGATISFVVRESRNYDPKADASDVFGSNDGKPHLNLITCEGAWNEAEKSYSNRLVVFTDKETE